MTADLTGDGTHAIIRDTIRLDPDRMVAFHFVDRQGRTRRRVLFRVDSSGGVWFLDPTRKTEQKIGRAALVDECLIVVLPL